MSPRAHVPLPGEWHLASSRLGLSDQHQRAEMSKQSIRFCRQPSVFVEGRQQRAKYAVFQEVCIAFIGQLMVQGCSVCIQDGK